MRGSMILYHTLGNQCHRDCVPELWDYLAQLCLMHKPFMHFFDASLHKISLVEYG